MTNFFVDLRMKKKIFVFFDKIVESSYNVAVEGSTLIFYFILQMGSIIGYVFSLKEMLSSV